MHCAWRYRFNRMKYSKVSPVFYKAAIVLRNNTKSVINLIQKLVATEIKIPLIAVLEEHQLKNLAAFIDWYSNLGVDRFIFVLRGEWTATGRSQLEQFKNIRIHHRTLPVNCDTNLKSSILTELSLEFIDRWVVFTDSDEFLKLPCGSLFKAIRILEISGMNDMQATSLDKRVSGESETLRQVSIQNPFGTIKYPLTKITSRFTYHHGNYLPGNYRSVCHVPLRAVILNEKDFIESVEVPVGALRFPTAREIMTLKGMNKKRKEIARQNIRIGFVTFDLGGPNAVNGGIATAVGALAKLLASYGFQVEIFYCPWRGTDKLPDLWEEYWGAFGIHLSYIPRNQTQSQFARMFANFCSTLIKTIKSRGDFDILHFHDTQGYASYPAILKKAGLDFTRTKIAITTHGGTRWHNEVNGTPWNAFEYQHELTAQRLCDVLISPSHYMISYNQELQALPPDYHVLPNVIGPESKTSPDQLIQKKKPKCIAFFSRIERRKGIDLFIRALHELSKLSEIRPEVLIIGKFGTGYSEEILQDELKELPFKIKTFQNLNPEQSIKLLKDKEALVILPTRRDNYPYVIYEAIENQVPFLVTDCGGISEMIHPDDRPCVTLPDEPVEMAQSLLKALQEGVVMGRPSFDPLEIESKHLDFWSKLIHPKIISKISTKTFKEIQSVSALEISKLSENEPVLLAPAGISLSNEQLQRMIRVLDRQNSSPVVASGLLRNQELGVEISSVILEHLPTTTIRHIAGGIPVMTRAKTIKSFLTHENLEMEDFIFALLEEAKTKGEPPIWIPEPFYSKESPELKDFFKFW